MKDKIRELVDEIRDCSDQNVSAVSIFINSEGYEINTHTRDAKDLEKNGVAVKNLRGEYIKTALQRMRP